MIRPFLEARGITQRFGAVTALENVGLTIHACEAVALMGGNGAGKSTLVSILSGLRRPESGEVRVDGATVIFGDARDARRAGIETVYQNLALCPNLDAPGNLFLGRELARFRWPFRWLDRAAMERETRATLADLGVTIPDLRATSLSYSGGQRQILAFARAARARSRLLILDEPTAALGVEESANVVQTVRRLRAERGMAVLLITHNLEEMRLLADRVVVLRRGRNAGNLRLDEASDDDVVRHITGGTVGSVAVGAVA
jgi:ABC-type sugar transport system ATPase subunit